MVKVTIGGSRELQCAEADVIKCLIVDAECLIYILNQLVHRQGGVVGFNYSVRDLEQRRMKIERSYANTSIHVLTHLW